MENYKEKMAKKKSAGMSLSFFKQPNIYDTQIYHENNKTKCNLHFSYSLTAKASTNKIMDMSSEQNHTSEFKAATSFTFVSRSLHMHRVANIHMLLLE